jgi:(4S)-4-hydroxy-5-phosphonooxypentane-2,3-dione isomerase
MTLALTVTFTLHPGRLDDFLPLMLANARTSLEAERGCRVFEVALPEGGMPDTVFLWEIYDDRAAFDAHLNSRHFRDFNLATASMVRAKTVNFYKVLP